MTRASGRAAGMPAPGIRRRPVAGLAVVAAAAALVTLAGCGDSRLTAPGSARAAVSRAGTAGMSAAKTRSSAPPSGNRAEADAIARGVLARLVLPPGSRRLAAAPARLSPGPPAPWSVDLHLQVRLE